MIQLDEENNWINAVSNWQKLNKNIIIIIVEIKILRKEELKIEKNSIQ